MDLFLNGIKLNELLDKIGQVIESRLEKIQHPSPKNQSGYLSRREVALALQISLPTLNEWTKLGWLQSYKMGNRVLYKADEVELAVSKVSTYKYKKGGNHGA